MKHLFAMMLLFTSLSVHALDCSNSARIKGKLIVTGDSGAVVASLRSDNQVQLENRFGAGVGVRYDFYRGRRVVQVYVQHGVVSAICRA